MTTASIALKRVQAQPNLTVAGMSATASTQRSLYPSDRTYTAGQPGAVTTPLHFRPLSDRLQRSKVNDRWPTA